MTTTTIDRRTWLLLLASVSMITIPHAWNLTPLVFAFFAVLMTWRFVGVWRSQWLPNRMLLSLLTLLGIALLINQQRGFFGRDAGTSIFIVALGLKLFEIRSRRDFHLVVYLAFIVAASQFLYNQSVWMAGFILAVSVLLMATLSELTAPTQSTGVVLRKAGSMVAQALPLAALMFVVFPRMEAPRWMWLKEDNAAKSGLSDVLEPGAISQLSLSDDLAFRVTFSGDLPPQAQRYWRGPVYVTTDGIRWTAGKKIAPASDTTFAAPEYRYTLLMEPQKENWVYALDRAKNLDAHVRRNANHELISTRKPGERAEYTLTSVTTYNTGPISDSERQDNLQLPYAPSPGLRGLVEQLGGFGNNPARFIENLLHHFNAEGFYYTLTPPLMPENPIETFLLETRSGFCSHYATAFVYLMRIAGIPAHVVGGYQGGEFNDVGGFIEVRQADAHAWAEVWLAGRGWVRFDPTAAVAPERIERGVNVSAQISSRAVNFGSTTPSSWPWWQHGKRLWQSLDYNWQRWVINYSNKNQMQVLQFLNIDDWQNMARWLAGSILLITLPLAWWVLRNRSKQTDPALICYRRFCRKLAKRGLTPETGEGVIDFAKRVRAYHPDLAGTTDRITTLFVRLRYEPKNNIDDLRELKRAIRDLKI